MHAVALGAELGVKKVVVPRGAPVFSAWGMMMSDLRRDYFVTRADRAADEADAAPRSAARSSATRERGHAQFARGERAERAR